MTPPAQGMDSWAASCTTSSKQVREAGVVHIKHSIDKFIGCVSLACSNNYGVAYKLVLHVNACQFPI